MAIIDEFIKKTGEFYEELKVQDRHRYRSFYLASWGMYRGSSFLLQYDYTIHTSVVKEILKPEYNKLFGIECKELNSEQTVLLLKKLNSEIGGIYKQFRSNAGKEDIKQDISTTLVTKVLLGALGCVPAYDRFFVDAVKKNEVTTGNYNIASLQKLIKFYEKHQERLEELRSKFLIEYQFNEDKKTLLYPQMKVLDMGFWKIGFDLSK